MSDDIVTRLRRDSQYMILWPMVEEAAAEIERLRAEIERLRAERDEAGGKVSDKQDIVDRLHNILLHEKDGLALTWLAICAANEIERLRAERDEARRLFCKCHAQAEAIGYAEGRGWDCFKEAGK
jgi:uncharacterized small protein (DUF1192 family)